MAKITRLGLYGGPRPLYGTFAGKEGAAPVQDITPTGIASAESFGTPAITVGAVTISPTGIASAESFGTPVITSVFDITPSSITSAESFGTAAITSVVDISPTGIASEESFGTPVVALKDVTITPTGIPSAESFGTPVITGGAIISAKVKFGKKFYANGPDKARDARRKALSLQMRQEDEEILTIVQIIGKILL